MADTATYDLIASQTLASSASSITFSSIAASWTDLRLVLTGTCTAGGNNPLLRFNGDTATNYSQTVLNGSDSAAASTNATTQSSIALLWYGGLDTTKPSLSTINIFSYTGSTYKTILEQYAGDLNGSGNVGSDVGLWRSTAAITSITLLMAASDTFKTGTTAQLYGIKAA
jgi:hypothetical protein